MAETVKIDEPQDRRLLTLLATLEVAKSALLELVANSEGEQHVRYDAVAVLLFEAIAKLNAMISPAIAASGRRQLSSTGPRQVGWQERASQETAQNAS